MNEELRQRLIEIGFEEEYGDAYIIERNGDEITIAHFNKDIYHINIREDVYVDDDLFRANHDFSECVPLKEVWKFLVDHF